MDEICSDVDEAELVSGLCFWNKIGETEQKVGQEEDCGLVEGLDAVQRVFSERPVRLKVYAHAEGNLHLNGELEPDSLPQEENADEKASAPHEEHLCANEKGSLTSFLFL